MFLMLHSARKIQFEAQLTNHTLSYKLRNYYKYNKDDSVLIDKKSISSRQENSVEEIPHKCCDNVYL